MNAAAIPTTLVDEIKVPIQDTLRLETLDGPQEARAKGLDDAPDKQVVVIEENGEVVAVASADELRSEILPRSWSAPLGRWLRYMTPLPETTPQTRAADLTFLVQENRTIRWLAVRDEESGELTGVVRATQIRSYLPPADSRESYRSANMRLWGDANVQNIYYYCATEQRIYGPNAVQPDAQGQMRDRKGHRVQPREPRHHSEG